MNWSAPLFVLRGGANAARLLLPFLANIASYLGKGVNKSLAPPLFKLLHCLNSLKAFDNFA